MRRERNSYTFIIISLVVVSVLVALLIGLLISRGVNNAREKEFAGQMSRLSEDLSESDTVSTQIGKSVEEAEKEIDNSEDEEEYETPQINTTDSLEEESTKQTNANSARDNTNSENKATTETNSEPEKKEEKENKVEFAAPIKGEILREFARDSLVFSNTLQEWVTHNGIDIKADKTSVVKAAAPGTVSAIKNDPRYGLTVIITHDNGYQTVYSNLLTSEFVVKGEKVEVGQSIGTVGNSASFEVADEYHLHFELLKDNEYIDPVIYINFE